MWKRIYFIWNPSNCECECDKSCDVGEYLDDGNYNYRKKLVEKLVEECTENIDGLKIAGTPLFERRNESKSSCTIYVVLIAIVFTISLGICTYFIYYKYMNYNGKTASKYNYVYQRSVININGKYQRNKH